MRRRDFLRTSLQAGAAVLAANPLLDLALSGHVATEAFADTTPDPAVTAAVNVLVPADPLIPGDFKGSDYGADVVLANTLGGAGQSLLVTELNWYAWRIAWKLFVYCTPAQQLNAIKLWLSERDQISTTYQQLLSALLSVSIMGTYERKTAAQRDVLFAAMGWYDPNDPNVPNQTFHIPNYGYHPEGYCTSCHTS